MSVLIILWSSWEWMNVNFDHDAMYDGGHLWPHLGNILYMDWIIRHHNCVKTFSSINTIIREIRLSYLPKISNWVTVQNIYWNRRLSGVCCTSGKVFSHVIMVCCSCTLIDYRMVDIRIQYCSNRQIIVMVGWCLYSQKENDYLTITLQYNLQIKVTVTYWTVKFLRLYIPKASILLKRMV